MKKRYLVILILGFISISAYFFFFHFLRRETKEAFTVEKNSDFYILASNSITSYQFDGGKINELSKSSAKMPEVVIPGFHKGEFGKRHLVISGGDGSDFTKDERMIAIDFQKGIIEQKFTEHYAYSGSGASENFFYTFQSTTEDGGLYQFDKQMNETGSYLFDISTTVASQFTGKNDKLYFTATQPSKEDDSIYEHYLFTFDESTLELLDKKLLDDNPEIIYGLTSMTVLDNYVYSPIAETRNRQTYERTPNSTFLEYNLETGEKEYFTLPENYSYLVYASKTSKYLMFVHEPHSLQKAAISVFNRETKQSHFVDVSEIFGNFDVMENQVMSVNTDNENRLFILTQMGLAIWDMEANERIAKYTDVDETGFYIWINE